MIQATAAGLLACLSTTLLVAALACRTNAAVAVRAGFAGGRSPPSAWADRVGRLASKVGALSTVRRVASLGLIERRLAAARWRTTVEKVAGMKAMVALGAGLLLLIAPQPAPIAAPFVALVAFRLPDFALVRAVRRRAVEADRELPQLLDLLAAASSAGLSGPLALRRAAEGVRGPLAEEIGNVLRAVDLGGRWRDELRNAADRLNLPDLRRAVAALTRTESLGASLSEAMTELASQVREVRRSAAGERARKAPVKMLFPLVFLVLPAFLLLTVVPVLITTLGSIR